MYARLLLLVAGVAATTVSEQNEHDLWHHLFDDYNRHFHPHPHSGDGSHASDVVVNFGMRVTRLIDFDLKHQVLDIDAIVAMEWHDEHFEWNMTEYGGIEYINVDAGHIWHPDIVPLDSANEFLTLRNPNYDVHVKHDGECVYVLPVELHLYCHVKEHLDHHESVVCPVEFLSWKYSKEELDLEYFGVDDIDSAHKYLDLPLLDPAHAHEDFNRDWHITHIDHKTHEHTYACCPGKHFTSLEYDFTVEHRHC